MKIGLIDVGGHNSNYVMEGFALNQSGIYVPNHKRRARPKNHPIAIDLFCGCGGFSLGFMQAGFEIVAAVEWEPYAAITYMTNLGSYPINIHCIEGEKDKSRLNKALEKCLKIKNGKYPEHDTNEGIYNIAMGSGLSGSGWIKNHPEAYPCRNFWFGDIRKLKGQDILDILGLERGDVDAIIGGPPCQGFSVSGKREIADPRNNLVYEFGRMVNEIQPKTFVMENVPGIVTMYDPDGVPVLDKLCLMLEKGGYGKWDLIKKSIEMQSGCAAVIKQNKSRQKLKPVDDEDEKAVCGQLTMDI